jgi:electron transport complex protein RnfA
VIFAGIREKMDKNDSIPEALKGLPITMIVAGLMSIAFFGFAGMITL